MIIPFFIPHSGCPHQCVFCNQKKITGRNRQPDPESIHETIETYLQTRTKSVTQLSSSFPQKRESSKQLICANNRKQKPIQVAFYGGTFTALPREVQKTYLETVSPFIESGRIEGIRISTRPDYISPEILPFLKTYHVTIVELGAQSMDDNVLTLAGRGHTAADTLNAVSFLREHSFTVGLQLMLGLPGDSTEIFGKTVKKAIGLKPDFVRLYPTLVIKGTPLAELYSAGKYRPLSLNNAVAWCKEAIVKFQLAGIEVIRIGLQPTEELEKPGAILAGPYHPAFRQLVESSIFLDKMGTILRENGGKKMSVAFYVNSSDISTAVGQGRSNLGLLKREFKLLDIHVLPDKNVRRGEIRAAIYQ